MGSTAEGYPHRKEASALFVFQMESVFVICKYRADCQGNGLLFSMFTYTLCQQKWFLTTEDGCKCKK